MRYCCARGGNESGSISRQLPLEPRRRPRTGRSWASFPDRARPRPDGTGPHHQVLQSNHLRHLRRAPSSAARRPQPRLPRNAKPRRKSLRGAKRSSLPASPDSSASVTRCWSIRSLCANYDSPRNCCQSRGQALSPRVPGEDLRAAEDRGSSVGPYYLRTRNRRTVTAPDRVLSSGSRSIRVRPGDEKKRMPSPSSTGRTYTRISSTSPRRRH